MCRGTDVGLSSCSFLMFCSQFSCTFPSLPCFHVFCWSIPTRNEFFAENFWPTFHCFFFGWGWMKYRKWTANFVSPNLLNSSVQSFIKEFQLYLSEYLLIIKRNFLHIQHWVPHLILPCLLDYTLCVCGESTGSGPKNSKACTCRRNSAPCLALNLFSLYMYILCLLERCMASSLCMLLVDYQYVFVN